MPLSSPSNPSSSTAAIEPLQLKITSEPARIKDVRHAVEAMAGRAGLDEKAVGEVGLCVNEAVANVIRHAYRGEPGKPIEVRAVVETWTAEATTKSAPNRAVCPPRRLRITIRDWGVGLDPSRLPERPRDPLTPGGLGLICMRQMMDSADYTPQPDGMLLTLTKNLPAGTAGGAGGEDGSRA